MAIDRKDYVAVFDDEKNDPLRFKEIRERIRNKLLRDLLNIIKLHFPEMERKMAQGTRLRILDVGAGKGKIGEVLRQSGFDYVGLEYLELEDLVSREKVVKGDAHALPFDADSFDVVITTGAVDKSIYKGNDLNTIFQEIKRVLKTGGFYYSHDWYYETIKPENYQGFTNEIKYQSEEGPMKALVK